MSESTEKETYAARPDDLHKLTTIWDKASNGTPQVILLSGVLGAGKRAMVGHICKHAKTQNEDTLLIRPTFTDEENGQGVMVKLYASLFGSIHAVGGTLRGRIEMAMSKLIPQKSQRVQNWLENFVSGMKQSVPKPGEEQFQVVIPKDNPLAAYVEIVLALSQSFPMLIDFQNVHNIHSLAIAATFEALINELKRRNDSQLMVIFQMLPIEENKGWLSQPLIDILDNPDRIQNIELQRWTSEDVVKYINTKEETSLKASEEIATNIAKVTDGKPGYIAELVDWLDEDEALRSKLPNITTEDFIDLSVDEEELEESSSDEEGEENQTTEEQGQPNQQKRKKAGVEDADKVSFLAALLGLSFPSAVVADLGGFERNSIDDLLDASEQLYAEMQHVKPLNSWVYKFNHALTRDAILSTKTTDDDKKLASQVGLFMEQFLAPRSFGFLVKTMRIYADYEIDQRAGALRNHAMLSDQPQLWNLARDLYRWFDDAAWPDNMVRITYLQCMNLSSTNGNVKEAEALFAQAIEWTKSKQEEFAAKPLPEGEDNTEEREELQAQIKQYTAMEAQLLMMGSKLDRRRQDIYRARDRSKAAQKIFQDIGENVALADSVAQQGLLEFMDGNNSLAGDLVQKAESISDLPPVKALVSFVRGSISQKEKKLADALQQFQQANQFAGQSRNGPLALDAGMKMAECLLQSNEPAKATDILRQTAQMAQQLRAPVQERACADMLAKANASMQNFEAALQAATRVLQLTQQLGFVKFEPADLYNVGLFNFMLKRHGEAASLLRQAKSKLPGNPQPAFEKEVLFTLAMAQLQIGETSAAQSNLRSAIPKAEQSKDWNKVVVGYQQLAQIAASTGNVDAARGELERALKVAESIKNPEMRKKIKEQMRDLKRG